MRNQSSAEEEAEMSADSSRRSRTKSRVRVDFWMPSLSKIFLSER